MGRATIAMLNVKVKRGQRLHWRAEAHRRGDTLSAVCRRLLEAELGTPRIRGSIAEVATVDAAPPQETP